MKLSHGLVAVLLLVNSAQAAANYKSQPGPFTVDTLRLEWQDTKRDRKVPAKIYFPKGGTSPCPVIVFSHGLGGTRDGYEYLGRHWASHGYVSIHLQHHGSDDATWRGADNRLESMRSATMSVQNSLNRPLDVTFAIDQLTKINSETGPLNGRLDLTHIGISGHSYGAFTTMAVAGQGFGPGGRSLADSRVKAAIAMSTPGPRRPPERNYDPIKIPILHLTGTADDSPIGDTKAAERRGPFDSIQHAPQWLITFESGDHMIFAGRSAKLSATQSAAMLDVILQSTTAFWDACLRDEATAKRWLNEGGCEKALGRTGVLEAKNPKH